MNFQSKFVTKKFLSLTLIFVFALYVFIVNWRNAKIANYLLTFFGLKNDSNVDIQRQIITTKGKYKDGNYLGTIEDVYYGNVQIKAVIVNGNLEDITFLQYPNDRDNSIKINTRAMPILKSEAIKIQDSNVDTVTGATQTSKGFRNSLLHALAQAQ